MTPNQKTIKFTASMEDSSILRKFTILFLVMSLIPTIVLFYFYVQIRDDGVIAITEGTFNITLTFIVAGVVLGYLAMRSIVKKIINLTATNKKALESFLTPEKIKELGEEKNEIAILARSFKEITDRLEENVKSLELSKRTLHSIMAKVGYGISNLNNIDNFLELILGTVTEAMGADIGIIMLYDPIEKEFKGKFIYGSVLIDAKKIRLPLNENPKIQEIFQSKKAWAFRDKEFFVQSPLHAFLFQSPCVCAPLVISDKVRGLISVGMDKGRGAFDDEAKNILYNLASQMAVAIENSRLNEDIEKTYFETISALAIAVDAKDSYSRGHLDRVSHYCVLIAKKLGLDEKEIKALRDAARLHDLGKIGIPDDVLGKKGPLNHQEWVLMRKHPEIGESILKPIRSLSHLCDIIRHHHEKLDGSGYPDGLKDKNITALVRILTVADIFDALTSKRSYRQQLTKFEACEELKRMNEKVDQDIVAVLQECLDDIDTPPV